MPSYPGWRLPISLAAICFFGALAAAVIVALAIGFFTAQRGALKGYRHRHPLLRRARTWHCDHQQYPHLCRRPQPHPFRRVLGVSESDLWLTAVLSVVILATTLLAYKPFMLISFDPVLAATLRVNVEFFRTLMLVLLSFTIVVSIQTVGVGLVAAMLVTPGATAYLLARRLPAMMAVSAVVGAVSVSLASMPVTAPASPPNCGDRPDYHPLFSPGLSLFAQPRLRVAANAPQARRSTCDITTQESNTQRIA